MASIIIFASILIFLYMSLWWVVAQIKGRNDIADVAWGLGFVALTAGLLFWTQNFTEKTILLAVLVSIWGIRLGTHIALRHRGKPEDKRYQKMRKNWKNQKLGAYLKVFLLQGFFLLLVAAPIMIVMHESGELMWYNFLGVFVWIFGFIFETVGDWQLKKFIEKPDEQKDGTIMTSGLWRYTRHPNYFGEITSWWGIFLIVLFAPFWYVAIIGPITITFLILGVSGIPMLEKGYKGNKEYEKYQETTSAFFPLPPRKEKSV